MEELNLADYFAIFRRWKKVFIATAASLMVLTIIIVMQWSNYRSIAIIQVEQPEVSLSATTPLGTNPRDAMEALADQRISILQQKILSTASLVEVITKFNLYAAAREDKPVADIAIAMRDKVKISLIRGASTSPVFANRQGAIAFSLSFDYPNALLAQQVTDELASRFLDQDLKTRRTEAEETSGFLADQLATMEASLSEQEKKIADFRKEHGLTRPENLAFNQQAAASLTLNLQGLETQITTVEGTLGALRGQLSSLDPYSRVVGDGQVLTSPTLQLKALQSQYAALTAQYGPEHPDVVKVRHQMNALQSQVGVKQGKVASQLKAQMDDIRANLAAAEKTYGQEHPDVIALKSQLRKLESQQASQKNGSGFSDQIIEDADHPAYLQVASQLKATEEQHKALLEQRERLRAQQETYQQAIIANPEAEQQLAALSRDYENAQARYRELKDRKVSADINEQMQKDRKGQRLSLINPPELPQDTQPPRKLLILAGFLLSLGGGLASVIAAQVLKQGLVGLHQVENVVGVAPLVAIPHIVSQDEYEMSALRRLERGMYAAWDLLKENVKEERLKEHRQRVATLIKKLNEYRLQRFNKTKV